MRRSGAKTITSMAREIKKAPFKMLMPVVRVGVIEMVMVEAVPVHMAIAASINSSSNIAGQDLRSALLTNMVLLIAKIRYSQTQLRGIIKMARA